MRRRRKTNWAALNRAGELAARHDFQRTTPGQRVEEQIKLSRELTRLASRRARGS